MKDKIKEILDYFKRSNKNKLGFEQDKIINYKEANQLLDYITNLQEENKKNKEYSEFYKDMSDKWKNMSDVFKKSCEEYKSRNEKAIEYIKNKQELNKMFGTITLNKDSQNELLNILQGSDKDD